MSMVYTYRALRAVQEMTRSGRGYDKLGRLTPELALDAAIQQLRNAEQAVDNARALLVQWHADIASNAAALKLLFDNLTPEEQAMLVEEKLKEEQ